MSMLFMLFWTEGQCITGGTDHVTLKTTLILGVFHTRIEWENSLGSTGNSNRTYGKNIWKRFIHKNLILRIISIRFLGAACVNKITYCGLWVNFFITKTEVVFFPVCCALNLSIYRFFCHTLSWSKSKHRKKFN